MAFHLQVAGMPPGSLLSLRSDNDRARLRISKMISAKPQHIRIWYSFVHIDISCCTSFPHVLLAPMWECSRCLLMHCWCQTDFWRPSEAQRSFARRESRTPCGLQQLAGAQLHLQSSSARRSPARWSHASCARPAHRSA